MGSVVDGYCLSCQPIVAAKRDLAERVLTTIRVVNLRLVLRSADGTVMRQSIVAELQRLFAAEGIELTTTQKEGDDGPTEV
jgi:hypothetical protein